MAITWITPVDKSLGSTGAWLDIDCSGEISASATGVIIHVRNPANVSRKFGLRKNGSTDDRYEDMYNLSHQWCAIGVDGAGKFEGKIANTIVDFWLVGYFEDDAVLFTNAVSKAVTVNTWSNVDISGDTGGDTAIGALVEYYPTGYGNWGFRKNGSTDARFNWNDHSFAVIGCDGSEIFEAYLHQDKLFVNGYITKDSTFITNATDLSLGSTGSYINLTALPAGATGGFIDIDITANRNFALRKDGSSEDFYDRGGPRHSWGMVEAASLIIEGKISHTTVDFFLVGYSEAAAASGWTGKIIGVTNPAKINGIAVASIAKVNNVA